MKEKIELTDNEKYECVVRWLNALNFTYTNSLIYNQKSIIEECSPQLYSMRESMFKPYYPCSMCHLYAEKCRELKLHPGQNWKILERFTGEQTVPVGTLMHELGEDS